MWQSTNRYIQNSIPSIFGQLFINCFGRKNINTKEQTLAFVQSLINEQDYIVQPLLQNHPDLQAFSYFDTLITIRLITIWTGCKAKAISAVLELPKDSYSGYVYALPIDIQEGKMKTITKLPVTVSDDMLQKLKQFAGTCKFSRFV